MTFKKFEHSKITGISLALPEKEICIYDELQYYQNSKSKADRMRKIAGFYKRRVADKGTTSSDLALCAANKLFKEMKVDKQGIDALIYVTPHPDFVNPSTAYYIHNKLGLSEDCLATDVNQDCIGWTFGCYLASLMVDSLAARKVLVVGSRIMGAKLKPANRKQAPLMGDAGFATIVEYSETNIESFYILKTQSKDYEVVGNYILGSKLDLIQAIIDGDEKDLKRIGSLLKEEVTDSFGNKLDLCGGYLNGLKIFDFSIKKVPESIKALMEYAGCQSEDIDILCLHQANKQMIQNIGKASGFPAEKIPYYAFEHFGNNSMCSIPSVIATLDKNINKEKLLCMGYGSGLSICGSIINLSDCMVCEPIIYSHSDSDMTPEEYINYWRNKIQNS